MLAGCKSQGAGARRRLGLYCQKSMLLCVYCKVIRRRVSEVEDVARFSGSSTEGWGTPPYLDPPTKKPSGQRGLPLGT